MRLSELAGKEIINIDDGMRVGLSGDADLVIDEETGEIVSIIVPSSGGILALFTGRQEMEIPWESIRKISSEYIIVEHSQNRRTRLRF